MVRIMYGAYYNSKKRKEYYVMAKFVLCSSRDCYEKLSKNIEFNFQKSAEINSDFGYLSIYRKLRIKTNNFISLGDDFAGGVGTFFYNNKRDVEALHDILLDFDGNINCLRDKIIGSYCIIIKKNNIVFVFVDPASTYNVYYTINEKNEIIATTTYYHLALATKDITIDEDMFISEWLHSTLRDVTIFKEVYKLTGDRIIKFENNKWRIIEIGFSTYNIECNLAEMIRSMYAPLRDFKRTGIFLTGGQDSRLSLSLLLALGLKPLICYGQGNSSNTSTKQKDLDVVKNIANSYKLPFHLMNWNDSDESDMNTYLNKYGELYSLYCMNKNFMKEFEQIINADFICFGYFGEIYRNIETIENYNKNCFTLLEYIDDMFLLTEKKILNKKNYKIYRNKIYTLLLQICKLNNLDENNLTKNDFQKLNTAYRQRWDTQINNYANLFMYSCPLFGDKKITDYVENISYNEKCNSKFLMKLISSFEKELLCFDFFSHIKIKQFNTNTFELTDKHLSYKWKDKIRNIIQNPHILFFLKSIYYNIQNDRKGLNELKKERIEKKHLKNTLENMNIINNKIDCVKAIDLMDARRIKNLDFLYYLITNIFAEK